MLPGVAEAAPTLVQTNSFASGSNTTSITVSFASQPTEGNLLVAILGLPTSGGVVTRPSGWTNIMQFPGAAPGMCMAWKVAASGESNDVTYTTSTGAKLGLHIYEYSGIPNPTYRGYVLNSGSSATPGSGTITTSDENEFLIGGLIITKSTSYSSWTNSFNERNDFSGGGSTHAGVDFQASAPGGYSTSATVGSSGAWFSTFARFVASGTVSGNVFEDLNYGGGGGRSKATSGGSGRSGARVEAFNASGTYITFGTTDADGNYTLSGLPLGGCLIRVVTNSVTSSRTGYTSSCLPVLTYRTDGSSGTAVGVGDHVGGHDPATADAGNAGSGWVLNSSTGAFSGSGSGKAHAFAPVTVGATEVTGVDFGFCFDVVANKNNSGQGSLRQFITNANALSNSGLAQSGRTSGIDNAIWMISNGTAAAGLRSSNNYFSGGVATLAPTSALTSLTDPVILDAQTQPGWSSAPVIELNGSGAGGSANGLTLSASGIKVRGFVINRFSSAGIQISGTNALVAGNWIGLDATGTLDRGNSLDGITISANGALIGGTAAADRNVVSGNDDEGIDIDPSITGAVIKGNYIGTDWSGTAAVGNGVGGSSQGGILAEGVGTQIGGALANEGNLISGNTNDGIYLTGTNNVIEGNKIGTNAAGTGAIANSGPGIVILNAFGGTNNRVGGGSTGQGNTIAFNAGGGIRLGTGAVTGNALSGNAIFSNTGLGIDLLGNGVTANDGAKSANQPNLLMDHPVFTSATISGTTLTVVGYVGSAPGQATFASARVEIFESDDDASGYGEGSIYLGFLTTDADGNFSGAVDVSGKGLTLGEKITGTATDTASNTSEFGANATVSGMPAIAATKDSAVISDPVNGTTSPKRIPGAVIEYSITISNTGTAPTDANSTFVADALDSARLAYDVVSAVTFVDGATASGLALGAVSFSSTAAPGPYVYDYAPVPDGDGCDGNVTSIRINTTGAFTFGGSPAPSFTIRFRVKVK